MYFLCTFCKYRTGESFSRTAVVYSHIPWIGQSCPFAQLSCIFLSSLAHSVDRTVGSICTAVTKVVDLSALEHLTGLDICKDCATITLGLLRLEKKVKEATNVCTISHTIHEQAMNLIP